MPMFCQTAPKSSRCLPHYNQSAYSWRSNPVFPQITAGTVGTTHDTHRIAEGHRTPDQCHQYPTDAPPPGVGSRSEPSCTANYGSPLSCRLCLLYVIANGCTEYRARVCSGLTLASVGELDTCMTIKAQELASKV